MGGGEAEIRVGHGLGKGEEPYGTGVAAAQQAMAELDGREPAMVLVFSSVRYDLEAVLRGVRHAVGEAPLIGATTAGEICGGPQRESVVVVALASKHLQVHVGVGNGVSKDWMGAVDQALGAPEVRPFFSTEDTVWQGLTREGKAVVCLLFSPGNTRHAPSHSHGILERLKQLSGGRLPIFGGSAADDWQLEANYALHNEQADPDSVLVAVLEISLQFGLAMAHGFQPTDRTATVGRVKDHGHEVIELDGEPAAEVFARLLDRSRESLEGEHLTLTTGQPLGSPDPFGQYSVNVASYFTPEGGVRMTQPVLEGTGLTVMSAEMEGLIAAGREALRKAMLQGRISDPALIIVCSCALRQRILGDRIGEEITGITEMVPGVPVVGFYSFGEQGVSDIGVSQHCNEAITVLVIGRQLSFAAQVARDNEQLRSQLEQRMAERLRAEQELRRSEAQFRTLFNSVGDAIFIHDHEGHFLEVNQVACERLGYSRQELLGKTPIEIDEPTCAAMVPERIKVIRERGHLTFETAHVRRDGTVIPTEVSSRSIEYLGQPAMLSVARDISERRRLEDQLRHAQKTEAIATLAGGIAHDFNNALVGITGAIDMLRWDLPPGVDVDDHLEPMKTAARRMATLTNQLLAYAQGGKHQPRRISLADFVDDTLPLLKHRLEPEIRVETDLDDSARPMEADVTQLQMVLSALLNNSAEAIEGKGRVRVIVRNVEIDEAAARELSDLEPGPHVCLTIEDDGKGMDEQIQAKIFDPFFSTKFQGRGLGMAAVYGIVKSHDGAITVESDLDVGTVVRVYLPAVDQLEARRPESPPARRAPVERGKGTVLVIDDEEVVIKVSTAMLKRLGYRVLVARTGSEALEVARSSEEEIDLALLDVGLPDMGGDQVHARLSRIRPRMKVLVCSGYALDDNVQALISAGAHGFLQKPFNLEKLSSKLRDVLSQ